MSDIEFIPKKYVYSDDKMYGVIESKIDSKIYILRHPSDVEKS